MNDKETIDSLTAELSTLRKELEAEQGRWQQEIYNLCLKHSPDNKIDGAGCDSGDPLDFTLTEISQAFAHLTEQFEAANKAQEWVLNWEKDLTPENFNRGSLNMFKELRELLKNGKD